MALLEVCTDGYRDSLVAYEAGVKRIELCHGLDLGGLSPAPATVRLLKQETDLLIIPILRCRPAGFSYDLLEKKQMWQEALALLEAGCDGLSFGFLNAEGDLDEATMKDFIQLVHEYHGQAVCHRAFDLTRAGEKSLESLIRLSCDRVLSSGRAKTAEEGIQNLARWQQQYGEAIEILAGGGISASNAAKILKETGLHQIHASCKSALEDPTTCRGALSFSILREAGKAYYGTDPEKIRALLRVIADQE